MNFDSKTDKGNEFSFQGFRFGVKHFISVLLYGYVRLKQHDATRSETKEAGSSIRKSGINPKCAESLLIRYSKHIN